MSQIDPTTQIGNFDGLLRGDGAGNVSDLKVKLDATTAPTINTDSSAGYEVGSIWIDVTADKVYQCVDSTVGAAVWKVTGGAVPTSDLPTGIPAANIGSGTVDNTEFGYLNGVTSSIQTQITDAQNDATQGINDAATVAASLAAHISDPTDSHDASSISVVPAGNIASTDVQAALQELDTEKSPTSHNHNLTGLADVSMSGVVVGQVPTWNGASWVNSYPPSYGGGGGATDLNSLTDVVLTGTTTGDSLYYNGATWVNGPLPANYIGNGDVSNTELSYLNGLTGSVQTQIDNLVSLGGGSAVASKFDLGGYLTARNAVSSGEHMTYGATNIYWIPNQQAGILLWNGSSYEVVSLTDRVTISLAGLEAWAFYDVFAYKNGSSVSFELNAWDSAIASGRKRAYRNDTVITDAGDNVFYKSGDKTRRWVGTICLNGSGTLDVGRGFQHSGIINASDILEGQQSDELRWYAPFGYGLPWQECRHFLNPKMPNDAYGRMIRGVEEGGVQDSALSLMSFDPCVNGFIMGDSGNHYVFRRHLAGSTAAGTAASTYGTDLVSVSTNYNFAQSGPTSAYRTNYSCYCPSNGRTYISVWDSSATCVKIINVQGSDAAGISLGTAVISLGAPGGGVYELPFSPMIYVPECNKVIFTTVEYNTGSLAFANYRMRSFTCSLDGDTETLTTEHIHAATGPTFSICYVPGKLSGGSRVGQIFVGGGFAGTVLNIVSVYDAATLALQTTISVPAESAPLDAHNNYIYGIVYEPYRDKAYAVSVTETTAETRVYVLDPDDLTIRVENAICDVARGSSPSLWPSIAYHPAADTLLLWNSKFWSAGGTDEAIYAVSPDIYHPTPFITPKQWSARKLVVHNTASTALGMCSMWNPLLNMMFLPTSAFLLKY